MALQIDTSWNCLSHSAMYPRSSCQAQCQADQGHPLDHIPPVSDRLAGWRTEPRRRAYPGGHEEQLRLHVWG